MGEARPQVPEGQAGRQTGMQGSGGRALPQLFGKAQPACPPTTHTT